MASFSHSGPKRSSHSFSKSKSDTGGIPKLNDRKQKAKSLIESNSKHIEIDKSDDQLSDDSDTNCNNLGFDLHYTRVLFRSFRRSLSKSQVHHNDDSIHTCVTTTFDKCTIQTYEKSSYTGNDAIREHKKKSSTTNLTLSAENSTATTASPLNKRKVFSTRKWLPPPLRKLSQGKVDKTNANPAPTATCSAVDRTFIKKGSDKTYKLAASVTEEDQQALVQKPTHRFREKSIGEHSSKVDTTISSHTHHEIENEDEAVIDLPPPMKPIQDAQAIINNGSNVPTSSTVEQSPCKRTSSLSLKTLEGNATTDLEEIEQIVKEKMEQHESSKTSHKLSTDMSEYSSSSIASNGDIDENGSENDVELALKKRMYALKELINTEEVYVQDLSLIVDGYIREIRNPNSDIPMPDDLKCGKERMVFGNVEAIYEFHRLHFLTSLQKCLQNTTELGPLIKRHERRLHMYVVYCQNKPVSEHIVAEHLDYFEQIRSKLGHRLTLCDLLIKPIQRITKYELLFKDIYKHTERAGLEHEVLSLREAIHVMKVTPKKANDMMIVGRLQKCEQKTNNQELLLHGPMLCAESTNIVDRSGNASNKPRELQVFLFEQIIIFADIVGKKTTFVNPSYIYKNHIQANKMAMEELSDNRLLVRSTDPQRPEISYIITAKTSEQWHELLKNLKKILKTQHDFLDALQSPIAYQMDLTKESYLRKAPQSTTKSGRFNSSSNATTLADKHHIQKMNIDESVINSNNHRSRIAPCTPSPYNLNNLAFDLNQTLNMTNSNDIDNCNAADDSMVTADICVLNPSSVRVCWDFATSATNSYVIEYCRAGSHNWTYNDDKAVRSRYILTGLIPGETYTFRLVDPNTNLTSMASHPVTMPLSELHMRQQQQFNNRYISQSELGRGRFSIVRLATDAVTGQRVALKQIYRKYQDLITTQEEYKLLASAQHPNIVHGLALFENAPMQSVDTVVMELVHGLHIFDYICQMDSYTESTIQLYMRQLVDALQWLHVRNVAHLDIKPENIMIDSGGVTSDLHTFNPAADAVQPKRSLKLIDFGDAVAAVNHNNIQSPSNVEFAAPELIIGQPLTTATDCWSFGILLYVFLSGVSPFLDDSVEETTVNILKCDFSFPDEYFNEISNDAKKLLRQLLVLDAGSRASMNDCQLSTWFTSKSSTKRISTTNLETFNSRRMRNSASMLQSR